PYAIEEKTFEESLDWDREVLHVPGRSTKRRSTILVAVSFASLITSFADVFGIGGAAVAGRSMVSVMCHSPLQSSVGGSISVGRARVGDGRVESWCPNGDAGSCGVVASAPCPAGALCCADS